MVSLLKRSVSGTNNRKYFLRYATIGVVVVAVDLTAFQMLVSLHVLLPLATTVAFVAATVVHFLLNKVWTFRVKGAPHAYQLSAIAVLFASFSVTQLVIEIAVLEFGLSPLAAKILALFVQLPVSFFGHRYFTFRKGRMLEA